MKCLNCGMDTHAFLEDKWWVRSFCKPCAEVIFQNWITEHIHSSGKDRLASTKSNDASG
jgi:hypothetical protein